jgi:carboxyl-terminal processing protease
VKSFRPRWRRARALATLLACWLSVSGAQAPEFLSAAQRAADFAAFCQFVEQDYAYFDTRTTDWERGCAAYAREAPGATTHDAYVALLERALGELYDHHAHLGTNTQQSPRLVPSQTDLVATWDDGKAIVAATRRDSAAERAGVQRGMQVVAIDGERVDAVVGRIAPKYLAVPDPVARTWALQVALAGRHERATLRLQVREGARVREFEFAPVYPAPPALLSYGTVGDVGYVRIHNTLGQQALVAEFDRALAELRGVRALVLDLRDTPSGGNSTVARGIMSRFVAKTMPYQRHEAVAELRSSGIRRRWIEEVAPRGTTFRQPLVVLVGRWTGSMGEGIAIGLNAARGAPVVGEPMAHLLGALGQIELPNSRIVVRIPTEKLAHVDGTPREAFVPRTLPRSSSASNDRELDAALALVAKLSASKVDSAAVRRPAIQSTPRVDGKR